MSKGKANKILIIALTAITIACASDERAIPADLLDKQTFAEVMVDVQLAEGVKTQFAQSKSFTRNLGQELYDEIFKRHGVSEDDFRKTYSFYQGRPDLMEKIYEQVLDSLNILDAKIKQEYSTDNKSLHDSLRTLNYKEAAVDKVKNLHYNLPKDSIQSKKDL